MVDGCRNWGTGSRADTFGFGVEGSGLGLRPRV